MVEVNESTLEKFEGLSVRKQHGYGWIPSLPDQRDFTLQLNEPLAAKLPASVDLRPKMPAVYDQGQLGSCTANGSGAAYQYAKTQAGGADYVPSRLFIYYNSRAIEGSVGSDSGAMVRDALKSVATKGAPPETDWPYDINVFATKPPEVAYNDGAIDIVTEYKAVSQDHTNIRTALADGDPVVMGFSVYESFESAAVAASGKVPLPKSSEQLLGGHCVLIVGYDKTGYIVRNSWGASWGMKGYFHVPFDYFENSQLASDFWVIQAVK